MIKNKVRFFREQKGLSQTELAEKAEISPDMLRLIEKYIYTPPIAIAEKISNILGVQILILYESGE